MPPRAWGPTRHGLKLLRPHGDADERLQETLAERNLVGVRSVMSRVELAEVLDVPRVWHQVTILRLQPCCARPGNMRDPERASPHG